MCDARLQQEGFGGRQFGRACLDAVVELNARIKSGSMTARKLGLVGENAAQIKAAGRLALGARKSADLHLARGMTVIGVRHHSERTADIVDDNRGGIDAVIRLGHIGDGAVGNRRHQILALKCTPLTDKQRARTHLARIVSRKFNRPIAWHCRLGDDHAFRLEQFYIALKCQFFSRRAIRHTTTPLAKPSLNCLETKPIQQNPFNTSSHRNMPPNLVSGTDC